MNYIKCFNRSRAAICLQPVFLSSWCLHSGTDGVLRPCAICARPGASMLARMEYYAPCAICARPGASILARMEYYAPCHLRPSRCLDAGTDGVLRPCAICARPGASMLARMEYYARVPFAPVLVPRCWHGWSITPRAICARPGASMLARMEYYAPCHLRPFRVSIPSCYTYYSISQILEFLPLCPLLAAHYRLYRASRILGNCKQM